MAEAASTSHDRLVRVILQIIAGHEVGEIDGQPEQDGRLREGHKPGSQRSLTILIVRCIGMRRWRCDTLDWLFMLDPS